MMKMSEYVFECIRKLCRFHAFAANIRSGKDIITSWRDANDIGEGRNACVIDCSKIPHEFWYWNESSGSAVWTKITKGDVTWEK